MIGQRRRDITDRTRTCALLYSVLAGRLTVGVAAAVWLVLLQWLLRLLCSAALLLALLLGAAPAVWLRLPSEAGPQSAQKGRR